jgi:elongation factor Ts
MSCPFRDIAHSSMKGEAKMMMISTEDIKRLRTLTSAGVMECKRALEEANGDFEQAQTVLQERAVLKAEKKADREVKHGVIEAYIHGDGRIGVLLEVHCETDFLSKGAPFRSLVKDLALQIASEAPQYINAEDVPQELIDQVAAEAEQTARAEGKPERVIEQIKQGKIRKFISEVCLMEQKYIKDTDMVVADLVRSFIGSSGENVQVSYFVRRQIDA